MMRTYEHKNKNEMKDGELHSEKRRKMFIWWRNWRYDWWYMLCAR
jgi:hypothetical protein